MSTDHGAIDIMHGPIERSIGIGLSLQRRPHPVPDPGVVPAIEAARDRAPGTIALGQVPPRRPGAQYPPDPVDLRAMIMSWTTGLRFLGRQQWLQPCPLFICQITSVHTPQDGDC